MNTTSTISSSSSSSGSEGGGRGLLGSILFCLWWLIARLPAWWHYLWADILYLIVRYVVHYRRDIVRKNLTESFPELSEDERQKIENGFYHHMCDLVVESIMYFGISKKTIMKRMRFKGAEQLNHSVEQGKSVAIFLGHHCNWEWISSLPPWISDRCQCLQLYHPLENATFDKLIGYSRERMGSVNVPMAQSIRHIMKYKKDGTPVIVGFIADQVPIWESMNYWLPFFHHDTPVMTGGERIARKLDMDCYYAHITKDRRGHYTADFQLITDDPKSVPEYWITEQYYERLEANIREQPSLWLWTHNRWKRTRAGFIRHLKAENRLTELANLRFFDHAHPDGQPASEVKE